MVRDDPQVIRAALNALGMAVHKGTAVEVLKTLSAHTPRFEQAYDACYQMRGEVRREFGRALCERAVDILRSPLYSPHYKDGTAECIGHILTSGVPRLAREETSLRAAELLEEYGYEVWGMV